MSASQPPPSSQIPGRSSGSGRYLAGILLLALGAGGLFFWKSRHSAPTVTTQLGSAVAPVSAAPPPPPQMLYAPPPPPKIEEEPDAGTPGKPSTAKGTGTAVAAAPAGPCGGKCDGQASAALTTALRGTAQSAQGCYNRALRTAEASGNLTVSVQISQTGSVCSASIANDSIHSSEISACVLSRFRGKSFPAPSGGCLTANIPISFSIKQ